MNKPAKIEAAKGLLRGPSPYTHCRKGHELTEANRIVSGRGCRICRRERFTAWQRKARASQSGPNTSEGNAQTIWPSRRSNDRS